MHNHVINAFSSHHIPNMNISPTKRQKTAPGSKKSSKAWNRLQTLRSYCGQQPGVNDLVANGPYSESGFKDVRTASEKEKLLQWVTTDVLSC